MNDGLTNARENEEYVDGLGMCQELLEQCRIAAEQGNEYYNIYDDYLTKYNMKAISDVFKIYGFNVERKTRGLRIEGYKPQSSITWELRNKAYTSREEFDDILKEIGEQRLPYYYFIEENAALMTKVKKHLEFFGRCKVSYDSQCINIEWPQNNKTTSGMDIGQTFIRKCEIRDLRTGDKQTTFSSMSDSSLQVWQEVMKTLHEAGFQTKFSTEDTASDKHYIYTMNVSGDNPEKGTEAANIHDLNMPEKELIEGTVKDIEDIGIPRAKRLRKKWFAYSLYPAQDRIASQVINIFNDKYKGKKLKASMDRYGENSITFSFF